ncbi:hypothetical protein EWM64_g3859 [Hericium alpestre]|uniref:RING-type domain-containing protein n=1 Tax=Hericium alpestre TaxID=135208 RepID=A0A4Z0A113_9AGAM|nr:hypothetical protein EWM64_g3859 [Hericium alpestre]
MASVAVDTEGCAVVAAISGLPRLTLEQISNLEDSCPICLISFRAIFEDAEGGMVGEASKGVTKVDGCGHIFCIEDLSEWIRGRHGTCPTCRHPFLPALRPIDSDAEESDGGEYVPTEYDADTDMDSDYEDGFMDSDGFDIETMDIEPVQGLTAEVASGSHEDDADESMADTEAADALETFGSQQGWWDASTHEWGLTDGDSLSASEGELSLTDPSSGMEGDIQIRLGSEGEYTVEEARQTKT